MQHSCVQNTRVMLLMSHVMHCAPQVKMAVFWQYTKAVGLLVSLFICFLYCCQNASAIGANVWLSDWTNEPVINGTQQNTQRRVGVYAALGMLQGQEHVRVMCEIFTISHNG